MNYKYKINSSWKAAIPITFIFALTLFSCIYLDSVEYEPTVKAGEKATFTMKVRIEPGRGSNDDRIVVGYLVPKVWNAAASTKLTLISSLFPGSVKTMSLIPLDIIAPNSGGLTWEAALRDKYGYGPNVLDDMEWLVYWSDDVESVTVRENSTLDVKIETHTSNENLKVKLGFFIGHAVDGFKTDEGTPHFQVSYTDCFEVVDGEGIVIDFCESHFNMFQPSNVTKDDIVTIKFQGGIAPNALDVTEEVYLCATAYTNTGNAYEISDRREESKMMKESQDGRTYSLTFWLGNYFNIPENESITRIEYFFSNKEGSIWVKEIAEDGMETLFNTPCICN